MIDVTCAIIRNEDNEVLIVQRGENTDHPLKWEFPGGKVNRGESEDDCIIREIKEELSMDIVICGKLADVKHDYGHKKIRLIPFICDTLDDIPFLSEHVSYKWIEAGKLPGIDFSEADIPVAENYLKSLDLKKTVKADEADTNDSDADISGMLERMMSSKEADWLATSTAENPAIFRKLTEYSFSADKKLSFHASWILSKACEKDPDLIPAVINKIIESLKDIDNESVRRSFLKIITLTGLEKIDPKNQGLLADFCFSALNSGFSSIAVKAYSMDIIYNLTTVYPELAAELEVSVRSLMEEKSSAGINARGRMILRKLRDRSDSPKPQ